VARTEYVATVPGDLLRERDELLEERISCVGVVADSDEHVQGNGLDHVEEKIVIDVHAGSVARRARPRETNNCRIRAETKRPRKIPGPLGPSRVSLTICAAG